MDDPGSTWREMPLQGDIHEIVAAFRDLPRRQLVVLGEPGAGKTALTVLLTLGLLEPRLPGEPVPVLLALTSWAPDVENAPSSWYGASSRTTGHSTTTRPALLA
jgi:hypothetical protein